MKRFQTRKVALVTLWAIGGALFSVFMCGMVLWAFVIGPVDPFYRIAFYKASAIFGALYGTAVGCVMVPAYKKIL